MIFLGMGKLTFEFHSMKNCFLFFIECLVSFSFCKKQFKELKEAFVQKCLLLYYVLEAWVTDKAFFAEGCMTVTE